MTISTAPAESAAEKLWSKRTASPTDPAVAENGAKILRFSAPKLTGRTAPNCYNFETLASPAPDFLAVYHHHY